MSVIYKYPIPSPDAMVALPIGAEVLHVAVQGTQLCLWARVFPENKSVQRRFVTLGTGHTIPDEEGHLVHLTTFLDGPFVWHVFEVKPA